MLHVNDIHMLCSCVAIESIHQQRSIQKDESWVLLKIEIPQNIQSTFNISFKVGEYDQFLLTEDEIIITM
jgi:hypothetical protein